MEKKEIEQIKELISHATFVMVSEESSREDLIEIIKSQLGFWEELKDYLNSLEETNEI